VEKPGGMTNTYYKEIITMQAHEVVPTLPFGMIVTIS
jgi:hypothetical protein